MILLGSAENGAVKKPDAPKAHPAEGELLVGGKKILRRFAPQNDKRYSISDSQKPDAPKAYPAECKLPVFEAFLNRPASLKNF